MVTYLTGNFGRNNFAHIFYRKSKHCKTYYSYINSLSHSNATILSLFLFYDQSKYSLISGCFGLAFFGISFKKVSFKQPKLEITFCSSYRSRQVITASKTENMPYCFITINNLRVNINVMRVPHIGIALRGLNSIGFKYGNRR